MRSFKHILWILIVSLSYTGLLAQGVSNGSITGRVVNKGNEPLSDANLTAIHLPSGTEYNTISRTNGHFNFPHLRTGGPYALKVTYVGYKDRTLDSFNIELGQERNFKIKMVKKTSALEEVGILADPGLKGNRPGVGTHISNQQIENLPSLERSFKNYTKLTPQKGNGLSFAGRNNFYNNLTVDGSLLNNSFGLAPLPGGQTNAQPISLDAIKSMQVDLSPFDVTQSGFTGAGINLVTRSGTNQFKGSAYSFFRNQDLVSSQVGDTKVETQKFNKQQYGFRASGPIVEDELFFFVNAEVTRRTEPASEFKAKRPGLSGEDVASVKASDLNELRNFLMDNYDYDPGRFEGFNYDTENEKVLLKLNWNINTDHKLSVRYNGMLSTKDRPYFDAYSGDQNTLPFENSAYVQHNNLHSGIARLSSNWAGRFSNELTVGFTALRDFREIKGKPFPAVQIGSSKENATTFFGVDPFSGKNRVEQNILQISDDFKFYEGDHTFTIGTSNRLFDFNNLFVDYFYGRYQYDDLQAFYQSANNDSANGNYFMKYSTDKQDPAPTTEMRTLQVSLYAQDKWQPSDQFQLTAGLRVDIPFYPIDLTRNKEVEQMTFKNGRKIDVSQLPDPAPHWSPRLGFNYQFGEQAQFQLHGGSGIFTGRPRFVWLANQAGNTGNLFGNVFGEKAFEPNRSAYLPEDRTTANSPEINKTAEDFKFPQVWRSSLALDYELPFGGLVASLEGVYSKDINAVVHKDVNLEDPVGRLPGPDNRVKYGSSPQSRRINDGIANAFLMENTSRGRQYNITATLRKVPEKGLGGLISYTYGNAKDFTSNPNSIAFYAYGRNPVVGNPNKPQVSWSKYDTRHRVVGAASYGFSYGDNFKSTISLLYNGQTGPRYSYVYDGDVNSDGLFLNNDLIYIPENKNEINLVSTPEDDRTKGEIWQDLNRFIEQDPYLSEHRGEYVKRNGPKKPWYNQLDLKFLQDFYIQTNNGNLHKLQVSVDIINVGNLINSEWGIRQQVTNKNFLVFQGYDNNGEPQYTFPKDLEETFRNDLSLRSRWRAQVGIRYLFN